MAGRDAFKVEGAVIEALSNKTYRVELANGHRLLGFVTGGAALRSAGFLPGDKVMLQLSPYDLAQGRILVKSENFKQI